MAIRPEMIASLNNDIFEIENKIHALEHTVQNARQEMDGCWVTYYEMKAVGVDQHTLDTAARINLELEAGITKSKALLTELTERHRKLLRRMDAMAH